MYGHGEIIEMIYRNAARFVDRLRTDHKNAHTNLKYYTHDPTEWKLLTRPPLVQWQLDIIVEWQVLIGRMPLYFGFRNRLKSFLFINAGERKSHNSLWAKYILFVRRNSFISHYEDP